MGDIARETAGFRCDQENSGVGGVAGIPKRDTNPKATPLARSAVRRKRLSDISNLVTDGRAFMHPDADGKENPKVSPSASTKEYIAQLHKENSALLRTLGERNKIIELSATEIQRLRFALQKSEQQSQQLVLANSHLVLANSQLAQANSQMLAERNQDKDRLKSVQHEIACTQAVLRTKNLELEETKKLIKQLEEIIGSEQITDRQIKLENVAGDATHPNRKTCNPNRKRRNQSLGAATMTHQVTAKEKAESRMSLRRGSFCEPTENCFDLVDEKFPIRSPANEPMNEDASCQVDSSAPSVSNSFTGPVKEEQEVRRASVGRPLRRAAEKVSSYKEVPLNVKMRRAE